MALFSFFRTTAASAALLALLSIMIPPPATAADQWANLPFAAGWTNYANGYRPVSVAKSGHIVTLSGLARKTGGAWGHIATLPVGMRPGQRLIFNVNTHDSTARVDVLPGGEVFFVSGNTGYGWVSLDGISFSVDRSHALPLTSGWQNYDGGYAPAGTIQAGETVIVNGLVKPGAGSLIATLPAHLRPAKRLIFNLNSGDKTARVDVLANGQIVWVYRAPARGWISLNGITFERKPGQALQLVNGWQHYQDGYAPATATRVGNRISVSGLLRSGNWGGHIATLPRGMCPKERLIFNLNNHDRTSRVDVLADCRIVWAAGGTDHGWLSLDGISFVLDQAAAPVAQTPSAPQGSGPSAAISVPWQQLSGKARDVDIGANGAAWIIGSDKSIWQWNGRQFQKMPGGAERIAVDPAGNAWVANQNQDIYRYQNGTWHKLPGGAYDIDVGADGTVWIIGSTKESGGYGIYRWDGRSWIKIPGAAVRIAVDPRGQAWVVNDTNTIYRYNGRSWDMVPGKARDVATGADGSVWIVGTDDAPYRWNDRNWDKHSGAITGITADPKGFPWAVNGSMDVYADRRSPSYQSAPVAQTPSAPQGSGPSAADADKVFHAYPKYRNVRVNWSRSGNALVGSARIGNANATVVAYKPQGKPSVSVGIVMPSVAVQDVLANLAGNNPMKSYRLQNVIAFLVPPGNQNNAQRIADLPSELANGVRQARLADGFALNAGLSYFGLLDTRANPLIANAMNVMGVGNPWTVSGGIVHTDFEAPQHSITFTAPLRPDPLQRIFGNTFQVIKASRNAAPSVFVTATGTNKLAVGYTSTFDVFGQTLDGTLEFTTEQAGETAVKLTLLRAGAWQNPSFGTVGVSNVTLHDTTIILSYSRDRTGTKATLALDPKRTDVHSTAYQPSSFSFTADGATGYPKAAFVNLATGSVSIRQIAELQDVALQLTPQGQLARYGNPYQRGVAVANTVGLNNLPIDAIKLANPKIYLATPGAVQPGGAAAPYPPLPEIFGAGVHVRGRLVAFDKTFGNSATQFDFKGLHTDTSIEALQFGAFTLQNPHFKLDAKTGSAPKARFTGSVKIGPVPISSAEIGIGKNSFSYAFSTSCFGAVRIRSSGSSSGFAFKFNAISPQPCLIDPIEIANNIKNSAIEVANVTQEEFNEQKKVVENEMKKIGKKAKKAAKFVANSFSKIFGKKKKKKKPDPPSHEELVNLNCGRGELPGYVLWQGSCQLNWVDNLKNVDFVGVKPTIQQSSTDLGTCAIKTELDTSTKGKKISVFGKTAYLPVYKHTSVNGRCFETYANNRVLDDSTMTQVQHNPWWEIDFKRELMIYSIAVYAPLGRADMLDGLVVAISDTVSGDNLMKDDSGAVRRYKLSAGALAVVSPQNKWVPPDTVIPLYARYMRIYRPGRSIVALGEVQVFGVVKR